MPECEGVHLVLHLRIRRANLRANLRANGRKQAADGVLIGVN